MARILVVDDHPTNREVLSTILGYAGHAVLEARDGEEALRVVRAESPDLVIADVLMPTMDGYELVRQLRADASVADTRVIFYTAHYHEREAEKLARSCGVSTVLTKPAEPAIVLAAVQAALGESASATLSVPPAEFDREHARLLTDKLSETERDLLSTNQRLSELIELSVQLGSQLDVRRLLKRFCEAARGIIGAHQAIVAVHHPVERRFQHLFTSGMDAASAARLGSPDPASPLLESILRSRSCARQENPGGTPVAIGLPESFPPVHAWLAAPIASPTHVYGFLGLIDKLGGAGFTEEDQRIAGILAAQVGRTYQNGTLHADVLRHASELELEVAERTRAQARQAILLSVSQALAEAASLRDAATRVLGAIGSGLRWDVGALWMLDAKGERLGRLGVWEATPELAAEWDAATRDLSFTPGEELVGRAWKDRSPTWTADLPRASDLRRRDVATRLGLHAAFASPILFGDGVLGVMEFFMRRFQEPDRDLLNMFTGITGPLGQFMERKRTEEMLRERDEQVRLLLDSTAEAIYGLDMQGNCTFSNRACVRLLGLSSPEELLGRNIHALSHHTHADGRPYPEAECRAHAAILTGSPSHVDDEIMWRRDGTSFPVEYWSHPVRDGDRLIGAVVTFLDTSHEKALQNGFREARKRLEHVVTSSPAVLFTLAVEGHGLRPTWISENVREMLGWTMEEVFAQGWWSSHVHPEDLPRVTAESQRKLFADGRVADEYRFRDRRGEYRWIRGELRLLGDPGEGTAEVVGSWSDITERKQLEDQFRQAQKMEAVGRLAGGVAHDFNNLLTVILCMSAMMRDELRPADPMHELASEINAAGERASRLTQQLLAFSRKQVLQPVVLDANELLRGMEKMLGRLIGEDIELCLLPGEGLWTILADPGQLEQVVMNIVVNARDAMSRGGKVTIETTNIVLDAEYVERHAGTQSGPHVRIGISDTGTGMDSVTASRVFEPFFSTKGERGTGLGLATVFGIVKQSGGHVQVYSEVGVGTTFKIYLPRHTGERTVVTPPRRDVSARGTEMVLVVEDEDEVRRLVTLILRQRGYGVVEASNGGEALLLCEQSGQRIDLVVTDVIMPKMSGRQLAERLAAVRPGVKVLYLSGYTDEAIVQHGVLEPGVPFLNKPFTAEALARKVREVLDA